MNKNSFLIVFILLAFSAISQKVSWTYSTLTEPWTKGAGLNVKPSGEKADITIFADEKLQQMEGFGGCFNEIGWEALLSLPEVQRVKILKDLFSKEGANFTLCRVPVGSNDYSFSYFSYDDVPEDFSMRNFNIDRDRYILIPYIKAAKQIAPDLKIWGSPWSPPAWMKVNNHYAMSRGGNDQGGSDMTAGKKISNNATAFKMEDRYLEAYALYFSKYVQAYKKEGIDIARICVQNEIVYQPHWPSCTWRPEDIAFFIGKYLGPRFTNDQVKSEIWLGTVNSGDPNYSRTVLNDKDAAKYVKGVGMQWDAKNAIETIHNEYPNMPLMQTESECGNGENNWQSAEYTWSLINRYISHGANSYMYWNMVLDSTGRSSWGWKQNMLISINKQTGAVKYNPEYYLMKHISHYILPGAYRLKTSGGKDHLAFQNPAGEIVLMMVNTEEKDKVMSIAANGKSITLNVKAKSINTIVWNKQ
jgi:glucosylceramidase